MNMLQLLTIILPIVALFCVVIIAFVNVFFVIRKRYPIKVNCWFCNSYSHVHYVDRNSFYCTSCEQYNGFNEDGDYNKLIPEQHDEMLNSLPSVRQIAGRASNGLCRLCNNNQQLKIHQLASFIPLQESTYDVEIQHFKNLLEKAYKLCPKCDQVLHHRLSEQNKELISQRILSMHKKSMAFLDINKSSKHATIKQKQVFFNFILYFTLILISMTLFTESIQNNNLSEQNFKRKLPQHLHLYISEASKYLRRIYHIYNSYFESVNNIHEVQEICNYINRTLTPVRVMIKDQLNMNISHNHYIDYLIANTPPTILNRVQETFYEMALTVCAVFLQLSTFLLRKHNIYTTVLWIFLLVIPYIPLDFFWVSIAKVLILTAILLKTVKKRSLQSTPKKISNKNSTPLSDSTATLSKTFDSSASDFSSYFNDSSVSSRSFHDLNASTMTVRCRKSPSKAPKYVFGGRAVISSPLLKPQNFRNDTIKSIFKNITETDDIQSGIMNLSLGKTDKTFYKSNHLSPSNHIFRTKPILSPPSFIYNSKPPSSWCTDNWLNLEFSSRCSSQTSGFVSIAPNELNTSLPDSASSSICGDFDRNSIISEPSCSQFSTKLHTSLNSTVFSTKSRLNHSTASSFSKINGSIRKDNGNSIGLFKPIVFNSDELINSESCF